MRKIVTGRQICAGKEGVSNMGNGLLGRGLDEGLMILIRCLHDRTETRPFRRCYWGAKQCEKISNWKAKMKMCRKGKN